MPKKIRTTKAPSAPPKVPVTPPTSPLPVKPAGGMRIEYGSFILSFD